MDEEALLKQFAAQFAHGPDDADDTDAAAAAQGADSTANQVADDADQSPATFDTQQFLNGLDAIFDRHTAATEAGPYLEQAMVDAENAGDEAGLLTVLNETMGFYRSQGRHKENQWIVQRALELAARMGLTTGTSEAWATTLINCATSMRAAKQYDQAEDLYHQAQSVCRHSLAPTDRRLAALHNNLSMLYIVKVRYRAIISATFASASEIGSVRFMPRKHTAPTGSPSRVTGTSACSVCASSSVTG